MELPGLPYGTAELSTADRIALTAAYDQLFTVTAQLHTAADSEVRATLLGLNAGRAAVTALTALCGLVSYLGMPHQAIKPELRRIILAAAYAGQYRELR